MAIGIALVVIAAQGRRFECGKGGPLVTTIEPSPLLELLGIELPIIQAPMAGISTPELAAAVSNARALGSISVGATNAADALQQIARLRKLTPHSFNVNVFCHLPARENPTLEAEWLSRLRPEFERFGAEPPARLREIYRSFLEDDAMLKALIESRPRVVSFHFGVPDRARITALREANIVLLGCATDLREARLLEQAGVHVVVAQGVEAGGHRGIFDPEHDERIGMLALTRLLVRELALPVVAAGGIMDGAGIAAVLRVGASAAQLGTAFIACPESQADVGFRRALASDAALHTVLTRAISGRPARCLANRFTHWGEALGEVRVPEYPVAYDAGKALNAAAKAHGEAGFGAHWAGQGAPLARALPAAELVRLLASELASGSSS